MPGDADPEALPPVFSSASEAEPLDIVSQAEPGNQLKSDRGHGSAVSLRQINCRDTALPCPDFR